MPTPRKRNFLSVILNLSVLLASVAATIAAVELILRIVGVASEVPFTTFDYHSRLIRFDESLVNKGTFRMGRFGEDSSNWRVNNHGWISSIEYTTDRTPGVPRLAVIGDSYIEGLHVDSIRHFARVLEKEFGGNIEVYSFGFSGAPLSHYLHIARYVEKEFKPDGILVLLIDNDFIESIVDYKATPHFLQISIKGKVCQEIQPQPYRPSWERRMLGRSAIVRYLLFNIKVREAWRALTSAINKSQSETVQYSSDTVKYGIECLTKKFAEEFGERRVIFVSDADRQAIYGLSQRQEDTKQFLAVLRQISLDYKLRYFDLTEFFKRDYLANGIRFNSLHDWHWNSYGHLTAGRAVANFLTEQSFFKDQTANHN